MIGQKKNKDIITRWRLNKSVPRFIIIEGAEGSGRLSFSKIIMKMLNATGIIVGNSIADVRTTIENCYQNVNKTVYIFRDCDDMSVQAKNALLKVVEEPPNNCYIIMTCTDLNNILTTLKSRASILKMEPYTEEQLLELNDDREIIKYLHTPEEVLNCDEKKLNEIIELGNDILGALLVKKSGTEILRLCTRMKSKKDDEKGIDCSLFFSVFSTLFFERCINNSIDYKIVEKLAKIRSNAVLQLRRKAINKKNVIESMLIEMLMEVK